MKERGGGGRKKRRKRKKGVEPGVDEEGVHEGVVDFHRIDFPKKKAEAQLEVAFVTRPRIRNFS